MYFRCLASDIRMWRFDVGFDVVAIVGLILSAPKLEKLKACSAYTQSSHRCTTITTWDTWMILTWVATPTGHVFRWHFLIIVQPNVIRGVVENPNSSAPSKAAITTSRPFLNCPSAYNMTVIQCEKPMHAYTYNIQVIWIVLVFYTAELYCVHHRAMTRSPDLILQVGTASNTHIQTSQQDRHCYTFLKTVVKVLGSRSQQSPGWERKYNGYSVY